MVCKFKRETVEQFGSQGQFVKVDDINFVTGLMVVGVDAREEEDRRDTFFDVTEVVASSVELVAIIGCIVLVVQLHFHGCVVDGSEGAGDVGANELGADDVNLVGGGELGVGLTGVAGLFSHSDHVHVDLNNQLFQVNGWAVRKIA